MKLNMFLKSVRFVAPILIASILASCSASQHAGVTDKQRPSLTETNEQVWFVYWQDQFDGLGGRVIAPAMEYPPVAKSAYARALQEWNMKEKDAEMRTYLLYSGVGLGLTLLLLFAI